MTDTKNIPALSLDIDKQLEPNQAEVFIPIEKQIKHWCFTALNAAQYTKSEAQLSIVICDADFIQQLNREYRQKDKATNVLSFPADLPEELELPLLGDLIICASIVAQEAQDQNKTLEAHWAHMFIHGTLHLLGYDHIEDEEADIMEGLETQIMLDLGFEAPYS